MGVPAFFRWLSRKYPSIVVHCEEEKPKIINGQKIPVDSSKPNTNNVEFDNLYLDMNGIIHPCCHPENKPAPKNEDEMMVLIFEYIDRIFSICRPRKLLYMAIDGVAPRAKMNQQRSRRFRASKEVEEKADAIKEIRESLESRGLDVPKEKPKEEHFDSNCITPGTPFMDRLAKCLHYYIHDRLNSDPGWRNIEIILSDANVPGEGEHKIMDFIRKQRSNPDHDPNTHHCLCGADADLIMLGLATHEPNFTIIREEFKPNQPRPCDLCGQLGHELKDCEGAPKEKQGEFDELEKPMAAETDFIFIRLCVLREYLERDLAMPNLPFPYDFERCIDDWVFMCFFVGNDFLPHLPSLEIREGAIDRLVNLYKKTVYRTGGYLTNSGLVNLSRVQLIMTDLGEVEDEIFKRRQQNEINFKQRNKDKKKRMKLEKMAEKPAWTPGGQFAPRDVRDSVAPVVNVREEAYQMRKQGMQHRGNLDAADALRAMLRDGKGDGKPSQNNDKTEKGAKRKSDQMDSDSEEEPPDEVRLWEDGFKERYYESKFEVDANNFEFRHKVGCASWKWFFPYHYAPFASDFINIGDLNCDFETGTVPFNPMEQLMGVFPAASKQHLPPAFGDLMDDPDSPIIDFYPTDFKIDLNGKKFAWQGVALLPFVDERRLLNALKGVYPSLTLDERRRNTRGSDRLYVRKSHTGYDFLLGLYENNSNKSQMFDLITKYFNGMAGVVLLSSEVVGPGDMLESPVTGLDPLYENATVCVKYEDPKYKEGFIFPAVRLPGAKDPVKVIKPGEYTPRNFGSNHGGNNYNNNWRPQIGMAPATQRASLDTSGFRKLDRGLNPYSEIAPPMNAYGRNTGYNSNPQMFQTQRSYDFGGYQQYGRAPVAPSDLYYQGNANSNPHRWGQQNRQAQSHSGNQGTHQQNYRGGNQSRDSRQDSSRPGGHLGHQGHQSGQRGGYQSGAGRGNYQQQSHYQSRR